MTNTTKNRKKPGPKPGSKNRASANIRKTSKQDTINPEVKTEIILIVTFALCILLFLCNFHLIGVVGETISNVLFGLIGILSYIFPIALFFLMAFYYSNKTNRTAKRKIISVVFALVFIGILAQMFVPNSLPSLKTLFIDKSGSVVNELYQDSSTMRHGGGVVFGGLAFLLYHYIGLIGTVIVSVVSLVICIMFLTQKSVLKGMKEKSAAVLDTARVEKQKRREARAEAELLEAEEYEQLQLEEAARDAEEILYRKDRKVVGVTTNMEIKSKEELVMEKEQVSELHDIHEINFADENTFVPVKNEIEEISIRGAFTDEVPSFVEEIETPPISITLSNEKTIDKPIARTQYESFEEIKPISRKASVETEKIEPAHIQDEIAIKEIRQKRKYEFPPYELLTKPTPSQGSKTAKQLKETAAKLQQILENFGVNVTVTDISQGPVVTRYELQPEMGVKVSKIVNLADDIKLNLAATDIRIEAPIPGKAAIGIEVPNKENTAVDLRELLESKQFTEFQSDLAFAVGKDIGGEPVIFDIAKMPHVLIAGATGSGKSVSINTLIMSLLYKAHPEDVKLIMIDPKVVELSVYNDIPHLLIPVVTDPKKASAALHWGVTEMTERYKMFADQNVRDLKGYNKKIEGMKDQPDAPKKLPQIVIIVDELADLMMVAPGEVEESICRLSQLARAAGIHLILATQRPSVDVITGLIKANMPSRIAFTVSSGTDSRTILDMNGAEKLLGKGDMLFYPAGYPKPVRVQGAFISDRDVSSVVDFLKNQALGNIYSNKIEEEIQTIKKQGGQAGISSADDDRDIYFEEAGRFIIDKEKASIGMLQRVFKIGFNRAARIMDELNTFGLVGGEEGTKPRKILMTLDEFEERLQMERDQ